MADEQAICTVINEQFGAEVVYKEEELRRIDDRIQLAKSMLHRLRLGILAQQYGLSGFYMTEDYSKENIGAQASWNSFESEFLKTRQQQSQTEAAAEEEEEEEKVKKEEETMEEGEQDVSAGGEKLEDSTSDVCEAHAGSTASSAQSSRVPSEAGDDDIASLSESRHGLLVGAKKVSSLLNDVRKYSQSPYKLPTSSAAGSATREGRDHTQEGRHVENPAEPLSPRLPASLSRFTTKKRIIVGNTSQFLDPSARSTIDGSTHKWMAYVRGPGEESDITSFVKAVRFFLHPSYHPNDIIRISKPPFHLTRYGWGEFPVRVQLEFADKCNKHVDIIHNLVLDRTHTGHQTLGSETVVDLDLIIADTKHDTSSATNSALHPFGAAANTAKSNRDNSVECSQHIHHIFVPASSTVDQVYLDHSYAHIVVVSQRPRLLQVSNDAEDKCDVGISSDRQSEDVEEVHLDELLHTMVKTVPLCGPESSGFHLVAPSIEHFKQWNIGRRRATEWVRALAIKRQIQTLDPPVHAAESLTTKQMMEWCRRNGYTPLDPVVSASQGFCKYCGCQLPAGSGRGEEAAMKSENISHARCSEVMEVQLDQEQGGGGGGEKDSSSGEGDSEQEDGERSEGQSLPSRVKRQFSTLSDPFQLFESLTGKAKKLQVLQEQQEREQVVDVLSVPARRQPAVETVSRFRIPQTPELKWVQRTAAAIGIHIYPAVIDRMYAHVVEHMIYMACTKFARAIMDRAVSESARQVEAESNEERCIVPLHIYRTVRSLESCDFLTHAHMGLPSTESATAPVATDRDNTLREE